MRRDSGFIACYPALAGSNFDFLLTPEVSLVNGSAGLLEALHDRVAKRKNAVIVVSERAGQHLLGASGRQGASGNRVHGDNRPIF